MTPWEFQAYMKGQRERREQHMEILAWVQSNLINPHVKKNIKPDHFYRRKNAVVEFSSGEEILEYMKKRKSE